MEHLTAEQLAAYGCKASLVMLALFIGFRILGKRQVAQLNLYDLAMIMAVSNAVQNAMTGGHGNLSVGLVTSTVVVLIAWFATRLFIKAPRLEERCIGTPTLLINDGRLIKQQMRRERISRSELMVALRAHGLLHPSEAKVAVLEVDGSISVVPRNR